MLRPVLDIGLNIVLSGAQCALSEDEIDQVLSRAMEIISTHCSFDVAEMIYAAKNSPDLSVRIGADCLINYLQDRTNPGDIWYEEIVAFLEDEGVLDTIGVI